MRDFTDFHRLEAEHESIHLRLQNWARYVRVNHSPWFVQPMFRKALTSRQWDLQPHIKTDIDTLDGHKIEKAVSFLPEINRDAVRWSYVFSRISINKMKSHLGVTTDGLDKAVRDGRTMLVNRL